MPIVRVDMIKGRTIEQKRTMVKEVTDAIVKTLDCKKEAVRVIITEKEREDYGVGGVLRSDSAGS